jgi:hypothetical protein
VDKLARTGRNVWKIAIVWAIAGATETIDGAGPKAGERGATPAAVEDHVLAAAAPLKFRGVFFNPNIKHKHMTGYPWPTFDPYDTEYRTQIRAALRELVVEANVNLIDVFIPIPFTLRRPREAPHAGQPLSEWANTGYLDNVGVFVDDCHEAGISVEFDLADNRWIPYSVSSESHIGRPGNPCWPVAGDMPWHDSAAWYIAVIKHVESRTKHPENIAMWCMAGHYQWGTAEPDLWGNDRNPAIGTYTERFVKHVWPAFRSSGKRPKAAPILLPIFSTVPYWRAKTPEQRLAGFSNLKRWLVDDLALPPDYWVMTTYPFCDPASDGFCYLRWIVEILGKENASRIISTDFKGPGHEQELKDSIVSTAGRSGGGILRWHFEKCAEYGFAGWWIFSYQDQEVFDLRTGIRSVDGRWKADLLQAVRQQAQGR